MKCEATQELVVGGFTDPRGRRVGLGALLVGYFDGRRLRVRRQGRHRLRYGAAAVDCASGWIRSASTVRRSRRAPACHAAGAHWVRPEVVVQVAFTEWTVHGKLRHPRLLGLRIDKSARAGDEGAARDHASREGAVSRRWHHQGRAGRVLRTRRAGDGAAPAPPAITMERFPNGIGEKGFIQKDVSKGFPSWLKRFEAPKKGGTVHYPLANDRRSLQWLANQNAVTLHVWPSRAPRIDRPDLCVFDLDPVARRARSAARRDAAAARRARGARSRELGEDVGIEGLSRRGAACRRAPRSTTRPRSRIASRASWSSAARATLTQAFSKAERDGRIYIDTGRNRAGATFAAAYTVRARSRARRSPHRARGTRSKTGRSIRRASPCAPWPSASPRSATSGRT